MVSFVTTRASLPIGLSILEHALASLVLFLGAAVFCLPVQVLEDVALPWWATRIGLGNVLLHELFFVIWFLLYGAKYLSQALLSKGHPTRNCGLALIGLAIWCGMISLGSPQPWLDLGRTARLLMQAAMLLAVVKWTVASDILPLAVVLLGSFVGTIINLVVSFNNPFIVNDVMRLHGQNTPGVIMGIAIHLAAWLFLRTNVGGVQAACVAASVVFATGCSFSYSRIGWFCGALGALSWIYAFLFAHPGHSRRGLNSRILWAPLVVTIAAGTLTSTAVREQLESVQALFQQKASGANDGDFVRATYVTGVAEIIMAHPFGVGYSGFFEAMIATDVYRAGAAIEEESPEANPHATFLWYASAGGVPGGLLSIAVFGLLMNIMRVGLRSALGSPGLVLFSLAAPSFLLIGLTVPYLLNSNILIVPAALAAGWGWSNFQQALGPIGSIRRAQPDRGFEWRFQHRVPKTNASSHLILDVQPITFHSTRTLR